MPFSADFPVPAISAAGVAKPKAHGQETTKTLTAILNAKAKSFIASHQIKKAVNDIAMTIGTNIPEILSASPAIGTFVELASSTSLTILYTVVSSPTCVALTFKYPPENLVPHTVFSLTDL